MGIGQDGLIGGGRKGVAEIAKGNGLTSSNGFGQNGFVIGVGFAFK